MERAWNPIGREARSLGTDRTARVAALGVVGNFIVLVGSRAERPGAAANS